MARYHRLITWLVATLSTCVLTFVFVRSHYLHSIRSLNQVLPVQKSASSDVSGDFNRRRVLHIALANTPRYHYEVVLPLFYALGHQNDSKVDLYGSHYGLTRLNPLPLLYQVGNETSGNRNQKLEIQEPRALARSHINYDIVVLTSCSRDLEYFDQEDFLNPKDPRSPKELICILHETPEWSDDLSTYRTAAQPWIDEGRITFIGLSEHVSKYFMDKAVSEYKMTERTVEGWINESPTEGILMGESHQQATRVVTFVPVFEPKDVRGIDDVAVAKSISPGFAAVQGNFESFRRDYDHIINTVANNAETLRSHNTCIRLIGVGDTSPNVSDSLKSLIQAHNGFSYPAFYTLLSRSNAILPAFARRNYFIERASSTVAASIIAGSPIMGTRELLEKYTYLDEDEIWLKNDSESDVEAWIRVVVSLDEDAWEAKKRLIQVKRRSIMAGNLKLMENMLNMIRKRADEEEQRGI